MSSVTARCTELLGVNRLSVASRGQSRNEPPDCRNSLILPAHLVLDTIDSDWRVSSHMPA